MDQQLLKRNEVGNNEARQAFMKQYISRIWQQVRVVLSTALVLSVASPVMAQTTEEPKARWVMSYALVMALIGLSLYSITRGSLRRKK